MLESSVSELFKYLLTALFLVFIVSVGLIIYQMNQIPGFKDNVSDIIARNGGLTTAAISEINSDGDTLYNGEFELNKSQSDLGSKPYGATVKYSLNVRFDAPMLSALVPNNSGVYTRPSGKQFKPVYEKTVSGIATSQVRMPQ